MVFEWEEKKKKVRHVLVPTYFISISLLRSRLTSSCRDGQFSNISPCASLEWKIPKNESCPVDIFLLARNSKRIQESFVTCLKSVYGDHLFFVLIFFLKPGKSDSIKDTSSCLDKRWWNACWLLNAILVYFIKWLEICKKKPYFLSPVFTWHQLPDNHAISLWRLGPV